MRVEELESKSDAELVDMLRESGVSCDDVTSRDELIEVLRTVPEDDSTRDYVEDAEVGMLVAFRTERQRVKSAKIVRKSTAERKLLLETRYGARFVVDYSDVIWVNTTGRWPRWVFELMKGSSKK